MKTEAEINIKNISQILLNFKRSITKVQDAKVLANIACYTAVNYLGFNFAWFGLKNPSDKSIVLLARFGETKKNDKSIILSIDDDNVNHPVSAALRNCSIATNFNSGQSSSLIIALPIMNTTHPLGIFCVSFDGSSLKPADEDIKILQEIADDCSRIINNIHCKAENELLKKKVFDTENRFLSIFDNSVVPMGLITLDGRFYKVNKAFCYVLGYELNELLDKDARSLSFPEDSIKYSNEVDQLFKGYVQHIHMNKRYVRKDGEILWADVTCSIVNDAAGKPFLISFVAQNITAKVQSYNQLKASEEKYRKFFENDLSGDFITTIDGNIKLCNKSFVKILGYNSPDELTGTNVTELYYQPQDRMGFINELNANKTIVWYENTLRHKNGTKITVMENAFATFDDKGNITEIQGYIYDITEKRKAEKNVQLLTKAVEQSPVSIVITDPEGNIEYVNPKFTSLTGYTPEEVMNKNPRILKSGYTNDDTYRELWQTITSGNEWTGEFKNINKNGEYYWESAVISPIRNSDGMITNYVAVKEDINEKKRILEELIIAKEAAEKSDKLKSEFLAQMSHEIRTPLTIVLSNIDYIIESLEEKDSLDDEFATASKHVETGGKRIIRTIELILAMSELEAGSFSNKPEPINIYSKILEKLYDQFSIHAKESRLQFLLLKNTANTFSTVDLRAAHLILYHIIENAFKFTNEGGVTITVENNSNSQLTVSIEDTGIGISEEYMDDIFTLFSQEDHGYSRQYDGNGLGLALTKRLCDLNGIEIAVKSEKEKGTIFTLTFPQ